MQRKTLLVSAALAAALLATGCGGEGAGGGVQGGGTQEPADTRIGVSLTSQDEERWLTDGKAIQQGLEELGYQVDLQYANNDIPTQQQQVDQMITSGADLLILAPLDGTALAPQIQAAVGADVPIISYDRLIRNSADVDLYVTFDNYKVGSEQATALLTGLGVLDEQGQRTSEKGPFNVELFGGSLDDNNATFVYGGAMEVLQPFIDDGTIVIASKQTELSQIATKDWSQQEAQARMDNLITSTYTGSRKVDAVLTPNDAVARGVITSLRNAGYGPTLSSEGKPMPVTTGQDAEIASVKLIEDQVQYATVFKNTKLLAAQTVDSAVKLLNGEEPEVNDSESYDNGAMVVPSFLMPIEVVKEKNIDEVLVESGYYTAEQVKAGQL
ncbi:sugar-binding protein [Arthrobacter crystallopoietes]|uniref:Monosaccharide ABC transporter substrate-binding protein, CUT2 family n=1 Tax=Crystallibacter crystallopoietes TaxID=37928 RepID=A0A1H0ZHX7_9MICC|nr:sugar-binding protein [Arthrobacter crystallopoietes]AUI51967.1 sugar ABC transporter substrate-binding protein [Arthrobacter crystallopoietes]SDQ27053.1 monosaccharide ABC transporter substrate-binding protein, CUT2 family [Arthrobacter crystallopoietes]